MEHTRDRIRRFILDNFYVPDPGRLGDDVSLIGTGVVDSTGMLEIIELLEGEMGVEVGDRDIIPANFDTIGRITAYVERKRAG